MIIRRLRKDEKFKSDMLMSSAFGFRCDPEQVKKEELDEKKEIIGAFCDDGETLMAQISLIEYESRFYGGYLKSVGIAGVATLPEYRRAGCVRKIFEYIFEISAERGWAASFLYPFSFRYYRKFGYERVVQHKSVRIPFSELSHIPRNDGAVLYDSVEQQNALLSVYEKYSGGFNVIFKRKYDAGKKPSPYKDGIFTYIWYRDGEPASYAVTRSDGRTLAVDELVYTDKSSMEGIIGFLRMYEGQYDAVSFNILCRDEFVEYIADSDRGSSYGIFDGAMGRIINIGTALSLYHYPRENGSINIKITGDVIEKNNRGFRVEYSGGKAVKTEEFTGEPDLEISVRSFSRLMLGDFEENFIEFLPDTVFYDDAAKKVFKKHPTQLFERF